MIKGLFANRSAFFQMVLLFAMLLTGFFIGSLIAAFICLATGNLTVNPMDQSFMVLQSTQFIASCCTFLLPAVITAWLCSERPGVFLYVGIFPESRLLGIVCLTTLLLSPTVSLTGYFNSQMHLPESMAAIEEWMKATEELANTLIRQMVATQGVWAFIVNLFVVAVVAGVTEELLFRGALLRIVRKQIHNHHVAIWIVAILFSAIHFQFYGFVPRLLLGAYLGYLIYLTNNIWVPVFAHFFHNAVAFIGMSNNSLKDNAIFAEEIAPGDIGWLSITAGICLIAFFYGVRIIGRMGKQGVVSPGIEPESKV